MLHELQSLGLKKNEALVYQMLAKLGPTKAGAIIAHLDIHRNIVYQSLEALVLNGYATKVIRQGVWHFQITDPHSLLTAMRQRERLVEVVVEEIEKYSTHSKQQIVVYEGLDSYRNYWISSLERAPQNTVDYVAGGEFITWSKLLGPGLRRYMDLVQEKNISWKTLYFKKSVKEFQLLRQSKVPYECRLYQAPMQTVVPSNFNIVGDTVILHTMSDTPRVIEMRDPGLVLLFQHYFNLIWNISKPIR